RNTSDTSTVRQSDHSSSSNQFPYGVPGPSTFNMNSQNSNMQYGESGSNMVSSNKKTLSSSSITRTELELCSINMRGEAGSPIVNAIESIFKPAGKGNESKQPSFFMYPGRKMISQIKNAKKGDSSEQNFENNEGVVHKRKRAVH
ncbi:7804_t:CDS:1, partial [Acaulospora colombiana]